MTGIKIISGGQTGVDRGALDAAIYLGLEHGGWCPRGRLAEDGPIPDIYALEETESPQYAIRTEKNVLDSDATLILYAGALSGGTKYTHGMANKHRKPVCLVDLLDDAPCVEELVSWLARNRVRILNVAGPRESSLQGATDLAREFMLRLFAEVNASERD